MSYSSSHSPSYSPASPELKLYQAFVFSVPIFFTFILLLLFYLFYLRRRQVNWASLRMRSSFQARGLIAEPSESGLRKELREMLPIIIFKESFSIRDTQCSVCLGDYQANEKLQQIPSCGHTFHMVCIDHWLATNTTCPLCRASLLSIAKDATVPPNTQEVHASEGLTESRENEHGESEAVPRDSLCDAEEGCCGEGREEEECVVESSVVLDIQTHGAVAI